jgi:hypothetical protein
MRSPLCLSACVRPNNFSKQSEDFREIQQNGHAVEADLDTIRLLFNPVVWTITKYDQTSEVGENLTPVNSNHDNIYADGSSKDEQLLIRQFLLKKIWTWGAVNIYIFWWRQLTNCCTYTIEVWCSERSWTYLQILFKS